MASQQISLTTPPRAPKKAGHEAVLNDTASPVKSPLFYSEDEWKETLEGITVHMSPKSKEIDSGITAWETPAPPPRTPPMMPAGLVNQPYQVHVNNYFQASKTYPARFSIFIGNLPSTYTDEELTQMVHDVFAQYGVCFGYARRNATYQYGRTIQKPWVVLQYTNQFDATEALGQTLADGGSHLFAGRRARVEPSNVRRNVYVYRLDGRPTGCHSLHAKLSTFGRLECSENPSFAFCRAQGIPTNGLHTQYETYGAFLTAKAQLSCISTGPYRYVFNGGYR